MAKDGDDDDVSRANFAPSKRNPQSCSSSGNALLRRRQLFSSLLLSPSLLPIDGGTGAAGLLVVVGLLGALALGPLYLNQERMLYLPDVPRRNTLNPPGYRSPAEYDSIPYQEHRIETGGKDRVSIHSWLLLQTGDSSRARPTICFFHGNAG